jgi:Ulp1 family protease
MGRSLHWYLAIIYFPEYTLLPRPVQERKTVQPRRSTRHLGVIIDPPDPLQPDPASRQSLPPDPDPPPNGQVHAVSCSEPIDPETPRTDDQRDEIDVELMVESGLARVDPTAEQIDEPQQVRATSPDTMTTLCPDSPTLVYPHSSPPTHPAILLPADPQGDGAEQLNRPAPSGAGEGDTISTPGIPPSTFYGTKSQGRGDVNPQLPPVSDNALPETEIDEDETMGNPESEPEEVAEYVSLFFQLKKYRSWASRHPRTYIYTFDSLSSKHPQAVKRLSKYLVMEAHDKRHLDEVTLNEPKGMQAIVGIQLVFCEARVGFSCFLGAPSTQLL